MPRREILNSVDRENLFCLPEPLDDLLQYYSFSEADLSLINQRRGDHNRLGFAVQLCYLRYPGLALPSNTKPPETLLSLIGQQLSIKPDTWQSYAERLETRREHQLELQAWLKLRPFLISDFRRLVNQLTELAQQTDRGIVLANALIEMLRQQSIVMPPVDVIERICSEAIARGTRQVYKALTEPLSNHHRRKLDGLLTQREGTKSSELIWLRQSPGLPKPKHVLLHLERLQSEAGRQLMIYLPFALPDRVPFDISDKNVVIENR